MPQGENLVALIALVVGLILITSSVLGVSVPAPDSALGEWTDWAAKYVALVIAATKVWTLADRLIAKI